MAAHSIGSATVSFGLVSVPVQLFAAGESKAAISFNWLHKKDGSRLKQQYVCSKDGEKVERADMIKGYEFQKGQYVTFTPDELKALEERACDAENRARRSGRDDHRMYRHTRDVPAHATEQIQRGDLPRSQHPLSQGSESVEAVHVEKDVQKPDMHEHRRERTPPLRAQLVGSIAGSPSHEILRRGLNRRDTADRHRDEHGDVDRDDHERHDGTCSRGRR